MINGSRKKREKRVREERNSSKGKKKSRQKVWNKLRMLLTTSFSHCIPIYFAAVVVVLKYLYRQFKHFSYPQKQNDFRWCTFIYTE